MSTKPNPTNAIVGGDHDRSEIASAGPGSPQTHQASSQLPSEAALQALLAFSALHQQIRQRRNQAALDGNRATIAFALQDVLQLVAERALGITGASGAAIALGDHGEIICRGATGETTLPVGLRLNPEQGFTATCYRSGQIVRCDDSETDARVDREACRALGVRSLLAVPLRGPEGVVGVLEAFARDPHGFSDTDVRSLNLLGELIMEALSEEEPAPGVETAAPPRAAAEASTGVEARPAANLVSEPFKFDTASFDKKIDKKNDRKNFDTTPSEEKPTLRPLRLALLAVVTLVFCLGLWWWMHRQVSLPAAATEAAGPAQNPDANSAMPPAAASGTALRRVTGIRHWSDADSSTVVIDLQDQVSYEEHRLAQPDRIYFDLRGTVLARELTGKTIEVGDELLSRIRVAQPSTGITRVVLETKGTSNFSVNFEPNPARLVVEIRSLTAPPKPRLQGQQFLTTPGRAFPEISTSLTAEDRQLRAQSQHLRIVMDAGHGGWDPGTMGQNGVIEKDLALEIAERVGLMLEQRIGLEVIYTRNDDTFVPLERRAAIANQAGADLFVSVHANYSSDADARGVETYYTSNSPSDRVLEGEERELGPALVEKTEGPKLHEKSAASRKLAASVQQALYSALALKSSGVRNRGVKAAPFVVLTGTTMPAILAEVSFVSSPEEENKLQSPQYRQKIAEAIYRGIAHYAAHSATTTLARTSTASF